MLTWLTWMGDQMEMDDGGGVVHEVNHRWLFLDPAPPSREYLRGHSEKQNQIYLC